MYMLFVHGEFIFHMISMLFFYILIVSYCYLVKKKKPIKMFHFGFIFAHACNGM